MTFLFRCLGAAWCAVVIAVSGHAHAQTITLNQSTGVEMKREEERFTNEFPLVISRQDCFEGAPDRFPEDGKESDLGNYMWMVFYPTVTGASNGDDLEVWVSEGADCVDVQNRTGSTPQCALVYKKSNPTSKNEFLPINPRDLVERTKGSEAFDAGPAGVEDTCEADRNQIERNLSIYLILKEGDTIYSSALWKETSLDLVAPPPPDSLEVGAGDKHLFFEWEIEAGAEQTDTEGFKFYCVPSGTTVAAGMGGAAPMASGEGGAGGAGAVTCDQNALVAGDLPSEAIEAFECGEVSGRTTRSGQTEDVTNGTTYAVAVSSLDAVGNSGELSEITCITPKPVTTFYEGYKGAGGKGGGGFCQWRGSNTSALLWLMVTSGLILAWRRRRQPS